MKKHVTHRSHSLYIFTFCALCLLCVGFVLVFDYWVWTRHLNRWRAKETDLLDLNETPCFPIDFVLTWVDSTDERWKTKKQAAASGRHQTKEGLNAHRFPTAWNSPDTELHLAITSIQRFAPWANCIWVVTQRPQIPPRLQQYVSGVPVVVVHHDQMRQSCVPEKKYLDVFSSHAIEADVHNIPGLAEHFVYGNDDTYFGNDVFPRDFFTRSGKPLHSFVGKTMLPHFACFETLKELYSVVAKPAVLNVFIFGHSHSHVALTRESCADTEARFIKDYQKTRNRLFRNETLDLPPITYAVLYALHTGKAMVRIPTESIRYPQRGPNGKKVRANTLISKPLLTEEDAPAKMALERLQLPLPPRLIPETVLMLVAHPDDETIFGGADLFLTSRVHVVCLTNATNVIRTKELQRVVATLAPSVSVQLLTWNSNKSKFLKDVIQASVVSPALPYTRVVSHASDGEYGHIQHKETHAIAKKVSKSLCLPFDSFMDRRAAIMNAYAKLLEEVRPNLFAASERALRIYKSQNIQKYWNWSTRFLPFPHADE